MPMFAKREGTMRRRWRAAAMLGALALGMAALNAPALAQEDAVFRAG